MGSRVVVGGLVLGCVVGLLGGCSDDPDPVTPRTPTPTPAPAPTTPTSTAAPSPSPTPSVSLPLSALEDDPGVQLVREHLREYAQVVNDGGTAQDLADTSTPTRVQVLSGLLQDEAGLEYPGPVPWTPVEVTLDTAERRDVLGCLYNGGYAVDRETGQPTEELVNVPSVAMLVRDDGVWKIEGLFVEGIPDPPDCSTVTVQEVPW